MNILSTMQERAFENIHYYYDQKTGLRAIIAIHNTQRGPALGGCRYYPYASEEAGLADVMNLAQAMTFKASLAGLPLGGGKSVIFGDPKTDKTPEKLIAFGGFVESLGGKYITSVDSGTSPEDLNLFLSKTKHVTGMTSDHGGSGDPSPTTALGVFVGLQAAAAFAFGTQDLNGKTVAIQGVGNVGHTLGKYLLESGAHLIVADYDQSRVDAFAKKYTVRVVSHEEILSVPCDILAPCALGGVINETSIEKLSCKVIAGAANNPLASMKIAHSLHERGIVYAPDFAINAGGLIHVADELEGFDAARVEQHTRRIYQTIENILIRSQEENISPAVIARTMAKEALEAPRS